MSILICFHYFVWKSNVYFILETSLICLSSPICPLSKSIAFFIYPSNVMSLLKVTGVGGLNESGAMTLLF